MCLASCAGDDATGDTTTPAATTTAGTTEKPKATNPLAPGGDTPVTEPDEPQAPALLDGSKFALDGKLDEYAGLHTLEIIGEKNEAHDTTNKKVTFYGSMTDTGLFLACDAYHDIYIGAGAGTFTAGADEYWVPKGTWPNNASKAIVASTGLWLPDEFTF